LTVTGGPSKLLRMASMLRIEQQSSWYEPAPAGYLPLASDQPWHRRYLDLVPPRQVHALGEWGDDPSGPGVLSPLGITEPFRLLNDEGVAILASICEELRPEARGNRRTSRYYRGALYRSQFLRGLYADPTVLEFLRSLAGAPLEPHPVTHHALQFNFAPDEMSLDVDRWHTDMVSFDVVLMVSDPEGMVGGRFSYFGGTPEEGRCLLRAGGIPSDRVATPDFPGPGWALLQQGHRVLHRAGALERPFPRVTAVASYYTFDPRVADVAELNSPLPSPEGEVSLGDFDGPQVALVEWARLAATASSRRLAALSATSGFDRPLPELREDLAASVSLVRQALDSLATYLEAGSGPPAVGGQPAPAQP
jgi:hypothetical protein